MKIKIAIVEDHHELREGLEHLINNSEKFICVKSTSSAEQMLSEKFDCDVILLDIGLPGISGIDAVSILKEHLHNAKVIMFTVYEDDKNLFKAIQNGADGYLLKNTPPSLILRSIEDVYNGGSSLSPEIAKIAIDYFKKNVQIDDIDFALSKREKEILKLIVDGKDNDEIADKLFISKITVRNHIMHIYEKLHVHTKAQAVAKAIKFNL